MLTRPRLIIVTGRPAAGKTTLSRQLAENTHHPLISRDQLKEDHINSGRTVDAGTDLLIYESFFRTIQLYLQKGISVIAEAAFQDRLWRPWLGQLQQLAEIRLIICQVSPETAIIRFENRLNAFPERRKYHGDDLATLLEHGSNLFNDKYEPLQMDEHSMEVESSDGYRPGIYEIIGFIQKT